MVTGEKCGAICSWSVCFQRSCWIGADVGVLNLSHSFRMNLFHIFIFSMITISRANRPNIVLVLTDDQDLVIGGLTPMVKTQQLVANKGVTLTNAFVTTPICCPSRSSILTGKYLHNHRTVNNSVSGGCNSNHWKRTQEPNTFVTHLKASGYKTFYAGKYLNQYGHEKDMQVPLGWDWWIGLVGNSRYYNYTLSINGTAKHFTDEYLTGVIKQYSLEFLRGKRQDNSSFCMVLAPPAPHAPFTPAPKYKDYFRDVKVSKPPNFNVPVRKDKHWLLQLEPSPLPSKFVPTLDKVYRHRWETLLSVDDMVESVVLQLDSDGLLNNTFFIFTSDNGYHIGQFSLPWDKRQPYETDIRVPFLVRGPGVPEKKLLASPVLNIDIAPTILDIAGINIPNTMDGNSILPHLLQPEKYQHISKSFLIEYHGEGNHNSVVKDCGYPLENALSECSPDFLCKCQDARNNTYKCIRQMKNGEDGIYCSFHDLQGFAELYDLKLDPYQLNNVVSKYPVAVSYFDKLISVLETCQGESCNI